MTNGRLRSIGHHTAVEYRRAILTLVAIAIVTFIIVWAFATTIR